MFRHVTESKWNLKPFFKPKLKPNFSQLNCHPEIFFRLRDFSDTWFSLFLSSGHLQLRAAAVHPHVLGEGGGQVAARGLSVRQVEERDEPGGGDGRPHHRQLRRPGEPGQRGGRGRRRSREEEDGIRGLLRPMLSAFQRTSITVTVMGIGKVSL